MGCSISFDHLPSSISKPATDVTKFTEYRYIGRHSKFALKQLSYALLRIHCFAFHVFPARPPTLCMRLRVVFFAKEGRMRLGHSFHFLSTFSASILCRDLMRIGEVFLYLPLAADVDVPFWLEGKMIPSQIAYMQPAPLKTLRPHSLSFAQPKSRKLLKPRRALPENSAVYVLHITTVKASKLTKLPNNNTANAHISG